MNERSRSKPDLSPRPDNTHTNISQPGMWFSEAASEPAPAFPDEKPALPV